MHHYPQPKYRPVLSYALHCVECDRWFTLDADTREAFNKHYSEAYTPGQMVPLFFARCSHCEHEQIVPLPGKYDRPDVARAACEVQHVRFTKATI